MWLRSHFTLLLVIIYINTKTTVSTQIKDLHLQKCDLKSNDSVSVENVTVQFVNKLRLGVTGTLNTSVDLKSPITAYVDVKRYVLFYWQPLPCVDEKGTCTYLDLCRYGVDKNKTCPKSFLDNGVPCRCPISKGTYTIKPEPIDLQQHFGKVIDGRYKGQVTVQENGTRLACYTFSFTLYDKDAVRQNIAENNEITPIVTIIE